MLETLVTVMSLHVLTALVLHGERNHLHLMLVKSSQQPVFYTYANTYNQASYTRVAHSASFAG